jgi:hypothetical protein
LIVKVIGSGFRVQGSGFKVQGSRFRVQGSRFRVQGSGFKVLGSRFWVPCFAFQAAQDKQGSGILDCGFNKCDRSVERFSWLN